MKNSLIILFLLFSFKGIAQNSSTKVLSHSTDRQYYRTFSPSSTAKGFLQIETGISYSQWLYEWESDSNDPHTQLKEEKFVSRTYQLPDFVFKYGIGERLEANIGTSLVHSNYHNKMKHVGHIQAVTPETYLRDWRIGLKYEAFNFDHKKGLISFLVNTNVPGSRTGHHLIKNRWDFSIHSLISYSLTDRLQVLTNLGITTIMIEPNDAVIISSLAILPSFTVSEKISLFTEYNIDYLGWIHHLINGGILYSLNNNLQMDLSGGMRLNQDFFKNNYFLSTGLSWRTHL